MHNNMEKGTAKVKPPDPKEPTISNPADDSLRRMTQLLKAAEAVAHIGGWEVDVVQNTLFWTDEIFRIHELSPAEYTPTVDTALEFYLPSAIPLLRAALQRAIDDGTPFESELELITAKGSRIWVYVTAQVIRENRRTTKIFGAFQDISKRKATEELLRKSEQHAVVGRMAALVAHEINNPLAGISNAFQLVKHAVSESHQYHSYVRLIEGEINRIAKIIRQMLDLYRPERELATELVLLNVLHDVALLLQCNAKCKSVQISVLDISPELKLNIQDVWLRQVLFNLVQNAVDASPTGGEVCIRTEVNGQIITITVEDHGKGIEPDVRPRLFDPFFTTKSDPAGLQGLGLGLSVSKNLVNAMGGVIEVETQLGVGSKFHIRLPRTGTAATQGLITPPAGTAALG